MLSCSAPASLGPLQDQEDLVGPLLAGELGRPLLAGLGAAELQRVPVELVDARERLALERPVGDGQVDLRRLLRRVELVGVGVLRRLAAVAHLLYVLPRD